MSIVTKYVNTFYAYIAIYKLTLHMELFAAGFVNKIPHDHPVLSADARESISCEFSGYLPKNGIVIWENKNGIQVATKSTRFSIQQSSGGGMAQNGSISSVRSVVSTLTIMSVEHADGGNYTCIMRGDNNAELRGTINTSVNVVITSCECITPTIQHYYT